MDEFRLAILAAQTAEGGYIALRNNLSLAIDWLGKDWQLTKASNANLIFMLASSAKSLATLQTLQRSYPIDRLIVASCMPVDMPQIKWHLPFSKQQHCPSVLSIVNVLSKFREHIQGINSASSVDFFEPLQHLTGIIEQCQRDGISRSCSLGDNFKIILVPNEASYYFIGEWEQLIPIALADITEIKVTEVSENELPELTESIKFGSRLSEYANFHDTEFLLQMGVKTIAKGEFNGFTVVFGACSFQR